jgi:hypothetical protein
VSDLPRPRLPDATKREIVMAIVSCDDPQKAGKIAERLWAMLRGDMQDRITALIYAAKGAIDSEDMNSRRGPLAEAVRMLDGQEAAATTFPTKSAAPSRERRNDDQPRGSV